MDKNLTFRAGQAGHIAGVPPMLQRDWRRKGVLPEFQGERARFSLTEVCHFRLIRAFAERDWTLQKAAAPASRFAELLASQLSPDSSPAYAVVIDRPEGTTYHAMFDFRELAALDLETRGFQAITILSLAEIGREMAPKVKLALRQDKAEHRFEALEARMNEAAKS